MGRYGGHGLTIALATALFAWLGSLVDERLGTEPLFVLLGVFLGFGAGFYSMYAKLVAAPRGAGDEAPGTEDGGRTPPGDEQGTGDG